MSDRVFLVTATGDPKLLAAIAARWFQLGLRGVEERDPEGGRGGCVIAYAESPEIADRWRSVAVELGARSVRVDERVADWTRQWADHLEPIALTPSVMICPDGRGAAEAGLAVLRLEARLVFGLGDHPTTRMAAVALERECRARARPRVLDFGSGTGVLSLVAALAGARESVGVDTDATAVASASRNAETNGLGGVCRFVSSLSEAQDTFDVVVANLDGRVIADQAHALRGALAPAGTALFTGFVEATEHDVARALSAAGFRVALRRADADWVLLVAEPADAGLVARRPMP